MPASGADGAASEDGAGQHNPVWSEGPWGRAAAAARTEVLQRATSPGTERGTDEGSGEHEGQWQTVRGEEASNGKALSDLPALKPYWGKPAVRNFREGNGNVGIIRSPLRAFSLPDQSSAVRGRHLSGDGVYLARGLVRRFVIDAPSPHCDKSIKYNRAMAFEPGVEC